MNIYRYSTFILLLSSLFACGDKKMSSEELLNSYSSGVVLVVNQYHYELKFKDKVICYFSDFKNDKFENFTFDESEIKEHKSILTGTGFFVSQNGEILTNKHVALPFLDKESVKDSFNEIINGLKALNELSFDKLNEEETKLKYEIRSNIEVDYWGNRYYTGNYDLSSIQKRINEIKNEKQEVTDSYNSLSTIKLKDIDIDLKSIIRVAFHESSFSDIETLQPCNLSKISTDENVDLALLKLKNEVSPVKYHVFSFSGNKDHRNLLNKILNKEDRDNNLYMLGYNYGFALANTSNGIKAQITEGKISQEPDQYKLLYSIPALPGSSGSPVLNSYGDVVAVNFAKVREAQNFNYGIVLDQINKFLSQ